MTGLYNWSTTASSNASVGSINFAEGQLPSTVNDSNRALMADVAAWRDFLSGAKTTSGTDTITLTSGMSVTAYAAGQMFVAKLGGTNTGAATLNIDSVGAAAVEINGSAVTAGDLASGKYYLFVYDGTAFQATRLSAAAGLSASLTRGYALAGNSSGVAAAVDISTDGNALVGDGTDAVATGIIKQGTHTIWVPAGAMRPTASNGCATLTDVETTAGRPDISVLDFDASSDEHAQFSVSFPKSWNEGTVTFQVFWTSTAIDTDGVTWALQGVAVSDGDTIDVAYGTAVTVDDANQSTAEDLYVSAVSGAVTIAGTPAAGDLCYFRVFRDVSDANDTAAEDARLIGVKIFYTVNAADDS
jgi:hypothetical protein